MKKVIGIVSACVFAVALFTSAIYFSRDRNVQVAEKYIGSDDYMFAKEEIKDIDILLERTDLVVKGYALNNGETVKKTDNINSEINNKYKG